MSIAIRCEQLGKQYHLGQTHARTLKDLRDRWLGRFVGRSKPSSATESDSHWALRDCSFDIHEGEVLGVIGKNGAGKSTLLKILSNIVAPTTGKATITGRVASLLEVGTGFHPELSGRENIYLNGSILGMTQAEITRKLDEIVSFAGVEKFLGTPVKRYSSGMYVRLAFAVAAHLDPEILIIDEVLAVGDAEFQRKCFEQMRKVGSQGRTILFVSHNMAAMRQICQRGILLESGRVVADGPITDVADRYQSEVTIADPARQIETESFTIEEVRLTAGDSRVIKPFDDVDIVVRLRSKCPIADPGLYVGILTDGGARLAGVDFKDFASAAPMDAGEVIELGFRIQSLPLLPGRYLLEVHAKDCGHAKYEIVPERIPFEVAVTPIYGGRELNNWFGHVGLNVEPICNLDSEPEASAKALAR